MPLDSSKDILYLVISFCIVWITVFLCWLLYYVMRLVRNANQIVEEFRMRLQTLTETINYIRGKVEHISGLMTLATDGVSGFAKKFVTKKAQDWMHGTATKFDSAAQDAVKRAVEATAKKMKKTAAKMKR
jgi:hypothetical protein